MVASPAKVMSIEEGRAQIEDREAKGFVQVPRSLRQRCKKMTAGESAVLLEVLDRGVSWGRLEPQKIRISEFCSASGHTKQAIQDGIAGLAARGVLYEEYSGKSKRSTVRYAIIDTSCQDTGPYEDEEGEMVINLLGGLVYHVDPVFLKSRKTGSNPKKQEKEVLESRITNPKKQENEILLSRKTISPQPAQQEAARSAKNVAKKVIKEDSKNVPGAQAAPVGQDQLFPIAPDQKAPPEADAKKPRKRDLLWDKAVELFHQPLGGQVKDWRFNILPTLHQQGITPEQLEEAAWRYREKYPKVTFSLRGVFNNLGDLLAPATAIPAAGQAATYRYFDGPAWGQPRVDQEGGR